LVQTARCTLNFCREFQMQISRCFWKYLRASFSFPPAKGAGWLEARSRRAARFVAWKNFIWNWLQPFANSPAIIGILSTRPLERGGEKKKRAENSRVFRVISESSPGRPASQPARQPGKDRISPHPEVRSKYPSRAVQLRRLPHPILPPACFDLRESSARCTDDGRMHISGRLSRWDT
jgi:hypothetical protein